MAKGPPMKKLTPLCYGYLFLGCLSFVLCWYQNLAYLDLGLIDGAMQFWSDTLVNPATRSITLDIFGFFMAAALWMLVEAKRLKIRFVWLYIIVGIFVAISMSFPFFLIARELKIKEAKI